MSASARPQVTTAAFKERQQAEHRKLFEERLESLCKVRGASWIPTADELKALKETLRRPSHSEWLALPKEEKEEDEKWVPFTTKEQKQRRHYQLTEADDVVEAK